MTNNLYVINNKKISKQNQSKFCLLPNTYPVGLSDTAYFNFCSGNMLKDLGLSLAAYGLGI